ncbi:MAG: methyltransferase [Methanoregulaceae archaeon]|nr:methyltransferase [Methanoregulaceae archaeon]
MRVRQVLCKDLRKIAGEEWRESARSPYVSNGIAYVPVKDGYPADTDLTPRVPYKGRGFHMLGTIAILHGREPTGDEILEIETWKNPTGILWVRSYNGRERIPDIRILSGTSSEVCHHELGMSFWLNPAEVMFSQGNRNEKIRMTGSVKHGERVADMFAGIGYFTIPVAKQGAAVHAMEINPVAYRYLIRNIKENHLDNSVVAGCGDCRDLLSGKYDRIIMGHFDAPLMLDAAFDHIREGGTIHMHAAGMRAPVIPEKYRGACSDEGTVRRIKKVAPHKWHYVLDMRVG